MYIKCWGTRGSLPRPTSHHGFLEKLAHAVTIAEERGITTPRALLEAAHTGALGAPLSFGGNTTCTEVGHGKQRFYIDMGSGFREVGSDAMERGDTEFHVFITHMHWDHVMGMPFFVPVFVPGHKINIYHVHKTAPDHIKINFNGVNFPLTWDQLGADIEFHQMKLYEPLTFRDVDVTPFALDHPAGCFGYRFEGGGQAISIGVDGEYKRSTPEELGKDLPFFQNLDVLLFDAQYEMAELASRFDWGHCTPTIGVDIALREGIRNLLFTHHDPWSTDDKLRGMFKTAQDYLAQQLPSYRTVWEERGQPEGPRLAMAYDGFQLDLAEP